MHEQGHQGLSFVVDNVVPPPDLLDTPTQVFLPEYNTQLPLSYLFHEWEHLPGVVLGSLHSSIWLQTSVWPQPPRFDRVHQTVVSSASKVTAGIVSLLKGAKEEVPQSDLELGFFSRYFIVPKRDGGLSAVRSLLLLDLRRLNLSLYKGKFKMLTLKTTMSQIRAGDWFVTIDLKDAYFHIQVVRRHRKFLRFAFGGKAYKHKVLPFGLALAPRMFTNYMESCSGPFEAPWHSCTQLPG